MSWVRNFFVREDGSATIEFGIIGSVYILCVVGLFDVTHGYFLNNRLDYAADRLSRDILMDPSLELGTLVLPEALSGLDTELLTVDLATTLVNNTTFRILTISYPASVFSPLFGRNVLNLSAVRTVYAES